MSDFVDEEAEAPENGETVHGGNIKIWTRDGARAY